MRLIHKGNEFRIGFWGKNITVEELEQALEELRHAKSVR